MDSSSSTAVSRNSTESSDDAVGSRKEVGGICLLSPTTTAARARPSAPIASATRICDASSNTTRSKSPAAAGKNRATESGDTSTQGITAVISSPYCASNCRTPQSAALLGQLALQCADLPRPRGGVEGPAGQHGGREGGRQLVTDGAGGGGEPAGALLLGPRGRNFE